jgi:transposase
MPTSSEEPDRRRHQLRRETLGRARPLPRRWTRPLGNTASERALRPIALGRKNYPFVGDVDAGTSIAGLYTIIATCEARGVNPFAYLADVIGRVQDHPADRLDELLPGAWAAAHA